MKIINKINTVLAFTMLMSSCSDFLDTLPDNRTELNSKEKITSLLVSAYPTKGFVLLTEMASDNVMDNGSLYSPYNQEQDDSYHWADIKTIGNDSPQALWNGLYSAIASANHALEAIEQMGSPKDLEAQKGEALLCRAYGHFVLATVFCEAYDPATADKKLGIPYVSKPEKQVNPVYNRGTLAETYASINADIEAGLPLIDDNIYRVPKYHFNRKAAYAFAARFNLFYVQTDKSNYEKVIQYANVVLSSNPSKLLRAWESDFGSLSSATDVGNTYISPNSPANLLIMPIYSSWTYIYGPHSTGQRYNHAKVICDTETTRSKGLWKSSSLVISNLIWNPQEKMPFPKMISMFEYTDKVNGIGYLHAVTVPFTTDETLLCRAEAYALKSTPDFANAVQDINYWIQSHSEAKANPIFTQEQIVKFYTDLPVVPVPVNAPTERGVKKALNPLGFTFTSPVQENIIQCVLHLRRIETIHEGMRWFDIKRYGIEFSHNIDGAAPVVLSKNDPRRAIQLPQDVISAGLEANPR